ncbi:unnamed protein product [Notodromas monacha]|uniref:Trichohyalin-plectin-homology domain-containing protein n=1 Tax=Notodromas monacha TaxID=399045 RepID=A0A7R9GE64_9CRUS|nr:unnamed protein product [Notodromas monacha]CAG0917719.1 unnamed protein product [Notodromas monacha]
MVNERIMYYPNSRRVVKVPVISTRPGSGSRAREIAEQIEKRESNDRRVDYWRHVADGFSRSSLVASQYESLGSERSFSASMAKVENKSRERSHAEFLSTARQRLRRLFEDEAEGLRFELESLEPRMRRRPMSAYPLTNAGMEELRRQAEAIVATREREREKVSEEKLYQLRKQNCRELREAKSRFFQQEAQQSWDEQMDEKKAMEEEQAAVNEEYERQKEADRIRHQEEEMREKKMRESKQIALRDVLKQQVDSAREKEERRRALLVEERELIALQRFYVEQQERRKQTDAARKKEALRSALHQQVQAKLRRKAAEMRQRIEEDQKFLDTIMAQAAHEREARAAKRRQVSEEMSQLHSYLAEQLDRERAREKETENLFDEEARRMWEKREQEWRKEDEARQQLMYHAIAAWGEQIEDKLKRNRQDQEENEKESRKIEEAVEKEREDHMAMLRKKREQASLTAHNYDSQIAEKNKKIAEEKRMLDLEASKENRNRQHDAAFVADELNKMRLDNLRMMSARKNQARTLRDVAAKFPVRIDILEKHPFPFGLVRFGVAPDHPEVKNVINTFTNTLNKPEVKFVGNVEVGVDLSFQDLKKSYDAVVLSHGCKHERKLGIPGEDLRNVVPAKEFVGWYNGEPGKADLEVDLQGTDTAVVVGVGNVALDVARILLTPVDILSQKSDITEYSLEALAKSRIRRVHIVGRRGPLQAAFTIKEIRELIKLKSTRPVIRTRDVEHLVPLVEGLSRPKKRLMQLLIDTAKQDTSSRDTEWILRFFLSPEKFNGRENLQSVTCAVNRLKDANRDSVDEGVISTGETETIDAGLALVSIGYHAEPIDPSLPFDAKKGIYLNDSGRIEATPGVYCCGWTQSGAVGVILSTLNNAFKIADVVASDLEKMTPKQTNFDLRDIISDPRKQIVSKEDWAKLDAIEVKRGSVRGSPREKIVDIKEALSLI